MLASTVTDFTDISSVLLVESIVFPSVYVDRDDMFDDAVEFSLYPEVACTCASRWPSFPVGAAAAFSFFSSSFFILHTELN